ncbi:MAG: hypothetical protein ACSLFK_09890 [Gemmatimonadaceae bacterium]
MRLTFPLLLTLAIVVIRGISPVTGPAGGSPPGGVSLNVSTGYVALSPVSRTLDALSLLSNPQTIALFVSLVIAVVAAIMLRRKAARRQTWKRLALGFAGLIAAIAIVEAAVVFVPRPMAALAVDDDETVRVDFHSHTGASHDVRKSFTAERNREWHRSGGFDIAYITDHVTFDGAIAARANNPRLAGDGTSLLTGVEGRYHRIMSTITLGLTEADTALLNRRGNLLPGETASARRPVTIVALPNRNLDSVTFESLDSLPRFVALELVDAAPRGLGQLDREEARIRSLATKLDLVLVAGSNNHGFGRTVAAWNLMRIPGWRSLPPDSVGRLIEEPFRQRDLAAVTIVRRTRPSLHGVTLAATLPVIVYQIIGTLTFTERLVWLAWIWVPVLAANRTSPRSPRQSM